MANAVESRPSSVTTAVLAAHYRQCAGRIGELFGWLRGCGPWAQCFGPSPRRSAPKWDPRSSEREDFEQLISFLSGVPLFQKQLPRSELPKVAMALQRRTFQPGQKVIVQGEEGKEFFIIQSGEAAVLVSDGTTEVERAMLYHGDYFGGRTLTALTRNVATIACKGSKQLQTLSLTRAEFERLGLHKQLKFPARPAIYEGRQIEDGRRAAPVVASADERSPTTPHSAPSEDNVEFIMQAVNENQNIRTRGDFDADAVRAMAQTARRRAVAVGEVLLQGGEVAHDFFVVSSGTFELIPATTSTGHRSVEARLATNTVHDRLARKQQFLMGVMRKEASALYSKAATRDLPEPNNPDEERARISMAKRKRATSLVGGNSALAESPEAKPKRKPKTKHISMRIFGGAGESPFKVGDRVARIITRGLGGRAAEKALLKRELGEVIEVVVPGEDGEVLVQFAEGSSTVSVQCLRPIKEKAAIAELNRGECLGELSLLYNTRNMGLYRAKEAAEVFAIDHRAFRACFSRETSQLKRFIKLLDEVHLLTPLLRLERAELARNSLGLLSFRPGEVVFKAGDPQQMWYVVESGACTVQAGGKPQELHRAGHFGEAEIFRKTNVAQATVTAGPNGVACVVFDGEVLRSLKFEVDAEGNVLDYSPAIASRRTFSSVPLDQLQCVAVLGEGGFGSVYLARHGEQEFALKRLSKGYIIEQNMQKQMCAERDILSMIDSPFIIHFFRSYRDAQFLYMLIEYATGGQLYTIMTDKSYILQEDEPRGSASMFYVACVSLALEHLHERNIMYRDLKPENILLDGAGFAKICDLGFARFVLGKSNTMVGTPEYMAPEMIDSPHAHDVRVDWWALGVLAFELLAGQVPYEAPEDDDENVMVKLLTIRSEQESGVRDRLLPNIVLAKDFIKQLLTVNEDKRLGCHGDGVAVRKHPWFAAAGFDFKALTERRIPTPHTAAKKVVERVLPTPGPVTSIEASDELFAKCTCRTTWDEAFG